MIHLRATCCKLHTFGAFVDPCWRCTPRSHGLLAMATHGHTLGTPEIIWFWFQAKQQKGDRPFIEIPRYHDYHLASTVLIMLWDPWEKYSYDMFYCQSTYNPHGLSMPNPSRDEPPCPPKNPILDATRAQIAGCWGVLSNWYIFIRYYILDIFRYIYKTIGWV